MRDSATRNDSDPAIHLSLAEVNLAKQMSLAKDQRDWTEFNRALEQVEAKVPNSPAVVLLRAEQAAAAGGVQDAINVLEAALKKMPDEAGLWRALAAAQARDQNLAQAQQAADEFERASHDPQRTILLRASILAQVGKFDDAEKLLTGSLAGASDEFQRDAKTLLADILIRSGKRQEGRNLYAELVDADSRDLKSAVQGAQLAWEDRDLADLDRWCDRLQSIEGNSGTHWRDYRVRSLLTATRTNQRDLREATRLLNEIEELRSNWSQLYVLRGSLARLQGRNADAIEAFNNSLRLGDKSINTCEQLLELLQQEGRFAETAPVLDRVRPFISSSDRLTADVIPLLLRGGDYAEAVKLAEERVRAEPKSALAQLRLATTLVAVADADKTQAQDYRSLAEAAFKQSVELAPANVLGWVSLLQFYGRSAEDQPKIQATLRQFSQKSGLPPARRAFVLAQIYESMGQVLRAGEEYATATSLQDPGASAQDQAEMLERAAASFYLLRSPALAEKYSRQAIKLAPKPAAPSRSCSRWWPTAAATRI